MFILVITKHKVNSNIVVCRSSNRNRLAVLHAMKITYNLQIFLSVKTPSSCLKNVFTVSTLATVATAQRSKLTD